MPRFVCLHGHFYQPPRESPWLDAVEAQESAWPFHDWNERVCAECYTPNAASRVLDERGRIAHIVNNYERISFNFGPTLLEWLEFSEPETYAAIVDADRLSRARFSGHGSALAQAYNHAILPLLPARDRRTQIAWGLADFRHRFGREAEGMWLPETAVDLATLEDLAASGVAFTVLAPHQAARVRRIGDREWQDVRGALIDPTRPYLAVLPSGRRLALFFYDGPISRAVAFEHLLGSGEAFVRRLHSGFRDGDPGDQLVHIATDGETYGHHHRFGDMALAWALDAIDRDGVTRLSNYGEYLAGHPPAHEVEIIENTSWSCAHGVMRWQADCGCNSGGRPGWNQAWRRPLRAALDWLASELAGIYERRSADFLTSPWAARDAYIDVVLDRSPASVDRFLDRYARRPLEHRDRVSVLKMLEMQRHALLMFTSCGWFFDDLAGIETTQILQYAGRALQLAQDSTRGSLESGFLARLAAATSNVPEEGNGEQVYRTHVKPAIADLNKLGAHWAIASLFRDDGERGTLFSFTVERTSWRVQTSGRARLALGCLAVTSTVTTETADAVVGVLHLGDHNIVAGVRDLPGEDSLPSLVAEITHAFVQGDIPNVIRLFDRNFSRSYSLKDLFRDEQKRILHTVLESTLEGAIEAYRRIYETHAPLMGFLVELPGRLPLALEAAAQFVLNRELKAAFRLPELDLGAIHALLADARRFRVPLDETALAFTLRHHLRDLARRVAGAPADVTLARQLSGAVGLVTTMPFAVDLWEVQNRIARAFPPLVPEFRRRAAAGDGSAGEWLACAAVTCELLKVRLSPGAA